MHFGHPTLLWLLTLVPALGLLLLWALRARRRALEQFVAHPLAERLAQSIRPAVRQWQAVLLVGGVLFLIVALAQPRWGFEWRQVKRRGVDVFVILDVSKSMLSEDVRPNRLTQAKYAVEDLLSKLQGDRVGLIAFAGVAFVQCPLTIDYEAFRLTLKDADPHIIPRGGTEIGLAIRTALKAFEAGGEGRDRAIVLITDGEQTEGDALAAADEAAKAGVRIYAIGVGTAEGELIPVREEGKPLDFVKDSEGQVVKSRLDETTLKQLALKTQGIYVRSVPGDFGMDTVYDKGIAQLRRQESEERLQKRFFERFQWPLGIGLFLLAIEMFVADRKRPNGNMLKGVISVCLLAWAMTGQTWAVDSPPEIYNQGVRDYRTNDFQSAVTAFEAATTAKDRQLQERAWYNLGDTCYRLGQAMEPQSLEKALPVYKKSLKAYEDSLALNPQDPDAKFNHELVKKKIEELQKKQEQQKQQQQQQNQGQNQQPQNGQPQNQQQNQGEKPQPNPQQQPQQAQNQQPPQQQPSEEQQKQQQEQEKQQAQAKQDQQKQEQQKQAQAQQQQKSDEKPSGESQSEEGVNLDKQEAKALLDNLREDEKNWNYFPELQMKEAKGKGPPAKDW